MAPHMYDTAEYHEAEESRSSPQQHRMKSLFDSGSNSTRRIESPDRSRGRYVKLGYWNGRSADVVDAAICDPVG
jgi:hypothetical protein